MKSKIYASVVLRISLSLVFLWFGLSQLINPDMFLGYLPSLAFESVNMMHMRMAFIPESAIFLIRLNGMFETVLGFLLITGTFTRLSSLFLSIHLFSIMLSLGYNDVAVRDFGLALAGFSVFLTGPDDLCFDNKIDTRIKKRFRALYYFDKFFN